LRKQSISKITAETSYLKDTFSVGFGFEEKSNLNIAYQESTRRRHRYCFHQDPSVQLHDIIIQYDSSTYIPPNKHIGKPETVCILQGTIDFYLFNDCGSVIYRTRLSAELDDHPFILRIPPNTWHGLHVVSDIPCIMKETITGPYKREALEWGEFAPSEEENSKDSSGFKFYKDLSNEYSLQETSYGHLYKATENVLITTCQFPSLTKNDLLELENLAEKSSLKRSRVCLHSSSLDIQQDMIIYLGKDCDIPVSYHLNKDEGLVVLRGSGKYIFVNDDDSVAREDYLTTFTDINKENKNKRCYARINRFVPHQIKPDQGGILIYEATTGPFNKLDTVYKNNF
tara:strand:- start:270 stop:1295 length:1026 start_codon:yes stop_codon:yes gene_type:complete